MLPKSRRDFILLSSPVAVLVAVALHYQKLTSVSGRLVGTWRTGNAVAPYALTTFKVNGEWEQMSFDGSGNQQQLFKGLYADSGDTFRIYEIRRYSRLRGVDTPMPGCINGNEPECSVNHEANDMDKEASDPKNFYTIVSADWQKGQMQVRPPGIWQSGGFVSTWTRQP